MPPKRKLRIRNSTSCIGAPAHLPDTGNLYTYREVITAYEMQKLERPGSYEITPIIPTVKSKWNKASPGFILRAASMAVAIDRRKAKSKDKKPFLNKLDELFYVL